MTDPTRKLRIVKLKDHGRESDLRDTTPAERIGMVWPLTVDAWAFMGEDITESRLPRHIVRVVRRKHSVDGGS